LRSKRLIAHRKSSGRRYPPASSFLFFKKLRVSYSKMFRSDGILVWENQTVRERLSWYYAVMNNQMPAKFLICKSVPCSLDFNSSSEKELWLEHERLSEEFRKLYRRIHRGETELEKGITTEGTFLDLKVVLLKRMLSRCNFCEWNCRVDRVNGTKIGACHMDATTRVANWFRHFGEEAPLVGRHGSGTIFFSGCIFRCVYCQNWDISQYPMNGVPVDGRKLALIMKELREEGAHNINLVGGEPTPNLHTILDALRNLGTNIAILWNSDMYASLPAMKILVDTVDIWLPDFKYGNDRCALRLSKIMKYFPTVARNHKIAHDNGDIIIRHLVLPHHLECCTMPVLAWIAENCPRALVNIMNQYHPDYLVPHESEMYADISRHPGGNEMETAYERAKELGILFEPVSF
jgi:putative pyruvate formate lyase activating enzyme